jgi:hypothetical protein
MIGQADDNTNKTKEGTVTTTASTLFGTDTTLSDAHIEAFRGGLRGEVILRQSASSETARRVWNGNRSGPALIVRCTGPADVQCA